MPEPMVDQVSMPPASERVLACFSLAGYPVCLDAERVRRIEDVARSSAPLREVARRIEHRLSGVEALAPAPRLLCVEHESPLALPVHRVEFHPRAEVELCPWPPFLAGLTETTGCTAVVRIGQELCFLLDVDRLGVLGAEGGMP